MKVFIDTGFYVARMNSRDQWHVRTLKATKGDVSAYTSVLVINETISLLQARGFFSTAIQFLRDTRENPNMQVIYAEPVLQTRAWDLFIRWGGSGADAVDCFSFAVMERFSIRKAFTFDAHFSIAGFQTLL